MVEHWDDCSVGLMADWRADWRADWKVYSKADLKADQKAATKVVRRVWPMVDSRAAYWAYRKAGSMVGPTVGWMAAQRGSPRAGTKAVQRA